MSQQFAVANPTQGQNFKLEFVEMSVANILSDGEENNIRHFLLTVFNVALPGVSLPAERLGNTFAAVNSRGLRLEFDPLQVSFIVDENFMNYNFMLLWLFAQKSPEEFAGIIDDANYADYDWHSDLILHIYDNNGIERGSYTFYNAHPTALDTIDLNYQESAHRICTVEFTYHFFKPTGGFEFSY